MGDPWSRRNNVPPATFHTKCRSCDEGTFSYMVCFTSSLSSISLDKRYKLCRTPMCCMFPPAPSGPDCANQAFGYCTSNTDWSWIVLLISPLAATVLRSSSAAVDVKVKQEAPSETHGVRQVPGPATKRRRGDHGSSHSGLSQHGPPTDTPSPVPWAAPPLAQAPPEPLLTSGSVLPSFVRVSKDTAPGEPVSPTTAPNEKGSSGGIDHHWC